MENDKEDIIQLGNGIWEKINNPVVIPTITNEDYIDFYKKLLKLINENGK